MKQRPQDRGPYEVQTVVKAVAILEAFEDVEELSLAELSGRVQVPKPTVFRLVTTLQQAGLLERRPNGSYCLGLKFVSIARLVLARSLPRTARPFMEELFQSLGHTIDLAVLDGGAMLYVDALESRHSLRVVTSVGAREPIHATAIGKAVAAELDAVELDRILVERPLTPLTPMTITARATLEEELAVTRQRGFAVDVGECRVGAHCIAAPIFDYRGVVGAISVSATSGQLPPDDFEIVGRGVSRVATEISKSLGADRESGNDAPGDAVTARIARG